MTRRGPLPFGPLSEAAGAALDRLVPAHVPAGTVLFRPGDTAQGFVLVLDGRVEVHLTGSSGREILLYSVEPGQSCVQTTLGLMGGQPYTGEAVATLDSSLISVPLPLFRDLMTTEASFRDFVFEAFGRRMEDMMQLLERVAFQRVEGRLARALLDLARDGDVHATQADLAVRIGSAREVVSRRLDTFARKGWVTRERGHVRLSDPAALRALAEFDSPV